MERVLLGMSGGVDSSVAAILLKNQGYEVVGATMLLCESNSDYKNLKAIEDVEKICNKLGIEHKVLDFREEFKKHVINDFICCYQNCKTPNPCIECNKYMKFGLMYQKAKELGCQYIATGHYAKTEFDDRYQRIVLKKSKSIKKDQSYVLYPLPSEIIENILFPLGDFETKEQIREIAKKNNLEVAQKPDSQDICFIPDGDYIKFLDENNIKFKSGNIVDKEGNILGKHNGLYRYTIGQRKGIGVTYKTPLYVIKLDKEKNEVVVGEEKDIYTKKIKVKDFNNLLNIEIKNLEVNAKVRYLAKEAKAVININQLNEVEVEFDEPQRAVTKGQSAVFYIDDVVVGGGKIL